MGSHTIHRYLAAGAVGYIVGTAPSADVVARLAGGSVDLRTVGSGNPGAANAAQVLGAKFGLLTMAADISKGVAAGRLGRRVAGPDGTHVAATAAVIGHCLPVWNGFHGGKGVATSIGQVLVAFPVYFPIDVGVAVATAAVPWWKQRTFAATAAAAVAWVGSSTLWWRHGWNNGWGPTPTIALPVSATVSSAVIIWRFLAADPQPAATPHDGRQTSPVEEHRPHTAG